jgi:hypothetical protein
MEFNVEFSSFKVIINFKSLISKSGNLPMKILVEGQGIFKFIFIRGQQGHEVCCEAVTSDVKVK